MVDCQPVFELLFIKFTEYINIVDTTNGINQVDVFVKFDDNFLRIKDKKLNFQNRPSGELISF